ncbi:MAG: 4Fe-4S dicluster domain-containing protein [Candidatus Melainabacteria bacterium]|nr:4Fe-4S dicluster domain-containing protein [Candidatus Melainabacteria bacterium]
MRSKITTIEEKLYITRLQPDIESHIKVNHDICLICKNKECTQFCPANVFAWSRIDDRLIISYENCIECGACKIGCPYESIKYNHPKAGYGLV